MISDTEMMDAALAGEDWQMAAAAILCTRQSLALSEDTIRSLALIAIGEEAGCDPAKRVPWVAKLIKILGDGHDRA